MSDLTLPMSASPGAYRERRAKLAEGLTRPLVVLAGLPAARTYLGNCHPFRAESSYLYLGGPPIEGAAWIIEPGDSSDTACMLLRGVRGFEDAVWMGSSIEDDRIAEAAGIDESQLADPTELSAILGGRIGAAVQSVDAETNRWTASAGLEPAGPDELLPLIDLRLVKDEYELEAMREAARISVSAHKAALATVAVGRCEADVAAAWTAVVAKHQGTPAFTPLISVRSEVLHGAGYAGTLEEGNLLLIDAGAEEVTGYACDITRTVPVSGAFTEIQRHLYEVVLRAEKAAIHACVPGKSFRELHELAAKVLCNGLVEAGLLRGEPVELASRRAHTLFFPHGLGHLIGLDAHDMEDFGDLAGYGPGRQRRTGFGDKYLRLDRELQPGMTVTIEPGLYLVPAIWQNEALVEPYVDCVNRPAVDRLLSEHFGGIRIEDIVCVRDADGPEVLTSSLPSEPDEIVQLIGTG